MALLGTSASAQQPIPPDIAARDRALADQMNRRVDLSNIEIRQQFQKAETDLRQRFLYDAWLEETWNRQGDFVFLPPQPPALGSVMSGHRKSSYPPILVDVVGEPFFMTFGCSYIGNLHNPRQLQEVDRYRSSRDRLIDVLRAKLATLTETFPNQRTRSLTEFATAQAKALHKLEAEAESLREEFSYLDDGSALLKRRDNPAPGEPGGQPAFFGPLLAAQFHPGLSIDQRQLLEAIAQEAADGNSESSTLTHVFFLPASARIHWPVNNDPALAESMQRFQSLRQALVAELTQAIVDSPANSSRRQLRKHYTELVARQAAQFNELHRVAEEIRIQLANVPCPDQTVPSGLPSKLVQLAGQHAARKLAFQTGVQRLLQELSQLFSPEKLRLGSLNNEPVIEVEVDAGSTTQPKGDRKKLLARLQQANEWLSRTHRELQTETKAMSAAITRYHESLPPAQISDIRELTARLVQTYIREENWRRYADYRTAVLTPGLSPAQRRLLFNAALRDLERQRLQAAN